MRLPLKKISLALAYTYIGLWLYPSLTFAARIKPTTMTSLPQLLSYIKNFLLGFSGALAVLFLVIGGIEMITSGGNPKRLETAKKTLTFAIIGLVAVLLSSVILQLIAGDFVSGIFG